MTGLDAERDVIVQAALIVTDRNLAPLEEFACDVWQPPEHLAGMTPFVRKMHTTSGLLGRLPDARHDVRDAERELLARVAGWCPHPAILCGNSIWSDRKFVDRGMPGLGRYLHYRMLDVSAFKLAVQLYRPDASFIKPEAGRHDALVDVRNSIAEFAHYRRVLLQAGAPTSA
jgi:oligoribonuclease